LVPSVALARQAIAPSDRAATRAYLEAELTHTRARLAAAPASKERDEALARRLGAECGAVLARAPFTTLLAHEPPERVPTPRQMGEQNRLQRQWGDLRLELGFVLAEPPTEAVRQAELASAHKIKSLRWTDRRLTATEHQEATQVERELQIAPPNLCGDMKTWAASGYQRISAGTKAFEAEVNAVLRPSLERLERTTRGESSASESPLRYAGPHEKALSREVNRLTRRRFTSFRDLAALEHQIERTLGIPQEPQPFRSGPPSGAVVIGHGKTTTGASYTIWAAPKGSALPSGFRCRPVIGVEEAQRGSSGSSEKCFSRSRPEPPTVECDEGVLTIQAQTLPRARRVRLGLSDGRQLISRVAVLPARLGGPAGFYYQAVRGPSPIPVSITELDARGRPLRTLALEPQKGCVRGKPTFTSGPSRMIASGSVPQGPTFTIIGERAGENGETHLELRADIEGKPAEGASYIIALRAKAIAAASARSHAFTAQTSTGCRPQEYAILYGVLRDPRDTVLARNGGQLTRLRKVRIPSVLHARGVLAYAGFQGVPSEVLVRSPSGKTLSVEKLTRRAREARETCEGEAEPPA
jgi:hypothetical protein